jgi:hypothetical protein
MARIKDRAKRIRLVRAGIIRLGFRAIKCQHCKTITRYRGKETTCDTCGKVTIITNPTYQTFPRPAEHFILRDAPAVAAFYGEDATELLVTLPFTEPDKNLDAKYDIWAGGVCVCSGDGELVQYANPLTVETKNNGKLTVKNKPGDTLVMNGVAQVAFDWNGSSFQPGDHVPCSGYNKDLYPHCQACSMTAILKVMMAEPELMRFAYYQISTGSWRNHDTILTMLDEIYAEFGQVSGIRYWLRLVEQPITYQDEQGRHRSTNKHFLQLEPVKEDLMRLWEKRRARLFGLPGTPTRALPATTGTENDIVIDADGVIIDAEDAAPPPYAETGMPATANAPGQDDLDEWFDGDGAADQGGNGTGGGNGQPAQDKPSRPAADPITVRGWLRERGCWIKGQDGWNDARRQPDDQQTAPDTKLVQRVAALMGKALTNPADSAEDVDRKRHSVLKFVWGRESTSLLTQAEALAMARWLEATPGAWEPNTVAASECVQMLNHVFEELGQTKMELPA